MQKLKQQILLSFLLVAVLLLSFACLEATCQEVEDESDFTYVQDSERGPRHWGQIRPEWHMCNSGEMQSPIDLLDERVQTVSNLGRLKRNYRPSNATLRNRGHDITLRWEGGAGHIHINGTRYKLRQTHWHSPSEHTVNGRRFELEVHLVHESADGQPAVVGIMYTIGRPDSFLRMLENDLKALADTLEEERVMGIVDPKQIKLGSRKYYRYIGSLTIPPCTQNVPWTMLKKVRTVSREQVKLFREAVHDDSATNARPIQPTNQRLVKLYRPAVNEEN